MWSLVALSAWAGPLDLPDPDDMGRFQCRDRPVDLNNDVELGDLELLDAPPGEPTYATGLASNLLPHATDKGLKAASKGKLVYTMPAVASLATGGVPIVLGCTARDATFQDDFQVGCEDPVPCELVASLKGRSEKIERKSKIGPRLAPVDDAKTALGLVAMLDPYVFLPMTPHENAAWAEAAAGYRAVQSGVSWVEVVEHDEGWVVRAPRRVTCGDQNDVVRRAWWVSDDGRSCQIEETPIPLAKTRD